jgi:hypothetical protein
VEELTTFLDRSNLDINKPVRSMTAFVSEHHNASVARLTAARPGLSRQTFV